MKFKGQNFNIKLDLNKNNNNNGVGNNSKIIKRNSFQRKKLSLQDIDQQAF